MNDEKIDRRRFVGKLAAGSGLMAAGMISLTGGNEPVAPARPGGEDPAREPARGGGTTAGRTDSPMPELPPAPGRQTWLDRQQAARELMRSLKIPALLLTPGAPALYLTGLDLEVADRLTALLLPLDGELILFCPAWQKESVEAGPGAIAEVRYWEEDEDPIALVEKHLKKADLDKGRLAIGSNVAYDEFAMIHAAVPKTTFISSTPILSHLRERKSPEETTLLKAAADAVEWGIAAGLREAREGIRERELTAAITVRIGETGARAEGRVRFGAHTSVPSGSPGDRTLAPGDLIQVEFGAAVHGYWGMLSRVATLGRASGRMKMIHETMRAALEIVLEIARPGLVAGELDQRVRATIGGRGFNKFLRHGSGHGVGLEQLEPPYLTRSFGLRVNDGNVIVLEPGVYTPGEYGIRSGEMIAIGAASARLLSRPSAGILEL